MKGLIPFSKRVVAPSHVVFQRVEEEAVVLNVQSELYFGLDAVATHMWSVLTASPSIVEAYDLLVGEYEVAPEVLREDLEALVAELLEHNLLEVVDG